MGKCDDCASYMGYRHPYVDYWHHMWVIVPPMRVIDTLVWVIVTPCGSLTPSYVLQLVDCLSTYDLRSSNMDVYDKDVMVHDIVDYNKIIDDKYV